MSALPDMQNLNAPTMQPGALSQDDVDRKAAELAAWNMLAEPLDPGPPTAEPDPWWVTWVAWPAVVGLTVAACFVWPQWVAP